MGTTLNEECLERYEQWLRSTDRTEGTIGLRMRHARELARTGLLLEVTRDDLERILARRRHLASETRKSTLSSWRLFYGWARDRKLIGKDPTRKLDGVKVRVRMPRVCPDEVLVAVLGGAQLRDKALLMLARYACLRLSELTKLHTRDRADDWLTILGKGDKERRVHVNPELLFVLRAIERQQGAGHYFPGESDGHLHPMSVNKIITRLTGYNPHSLRHAGATAAYRATGNLRGVQAMLGHASMATTQRYLHLDDDDLRTVGIATALPRAA